MPRLVLIDCPRRARAAAGGAAQRSDKVRVKPSISLKVLRKGAALDFVQEMEKRTRPELVKMRDEALTPKPLNRRELCLRREMISSYRREVKLAA